MRKDIEIPIVKHVHIVAVEEWDKDFLVKNWNVYLINNRADEISTVLVLSRGNTLDKTTSTLRHGLREIAPKTAAKVEFIPQELFGFENEYLVTFFAENRLFEKRFVFAPNSISEEKITEIPVMEVEGIIAE